MSSFRRFASSALGVSDLTAAGGAGRGLLHLARCLVAEFLATATLVLIISGASARVDGMPSNVQISLSYGLAYLAAVTLASGPLPEYDDGVSRGGISVGHANPAVTLGSFLLGRMGLLQAVLYVGSQCAGGIAGSYLLTTLAPPFLQWSPVAANEIYGGFSHTGCPEYNATGAPCVVEGLTEWQGFGAEALASFVLCAVAFSIGQKANNRGVGALILGLTYAGCSLFAGQLTGCGANPARSLGPAVAHDQWEHHWVFWAGPLCGSLCAAVAHAAVLSPRKCSSSSSPGFRRPGRGGGRAAEYDVTLTADETLKMTDQKHVY